jgi:predicted N-acetyltransferase YhbS
MPEDTYALRAVVVADAAAVASLIRVAFTAQSMVTDPLPSALRVTEADVITHLRSGAGAVAQAANGLVGSALWAEQEGGLYLARLAVAPGWRRRGTARALVAAAEAAAHAAGLPRIHLSTRLVLLDNRRLFAACGFVETSRAAHPGYAGPTFVNMEKLLAP